MDTLTAALWYRDRTFSRGTLRSLDPRQLFDGALRYENGNWSTDGVLTPAQAFDPESFLGYLAGHGVRWRVFEA